jgi:anti-anti-sigma factor
MAADTTAEVLLLGDEALISVHGELDLFSLAVLEEALDDVRSVSRVVIDLEGVSFLDCAALRKIPQPPQVSADEGNILRVDHATGMVRRLMDILNLDGLRVR